MQNCNRLLVFQQADALFTPLSGQLAIGADDRIERLRGNARHVRLLRQEPHPRGVDLGHEILRQGGAPYPGTNQMSRDQIRKTADPRGGDLDDAAHVFNNKD